MSNPGVGKELGGPKPVRAEPDFWARAENYRSGLRARVENLRADRARAEILRAGF